MAERQRQRNQRKKTKQKKRKEAPGRPRERTRRKNSAALVDRERTGAVKGFCILHNPVQVCLAALCFQYSGHLVQLALQNVRLVNEMAFCHQLLCRWSGALQLMGPRVIVVWIIQTDPLLAKEIKHRIRQLIRPYPHFCPFWASLPPFSQEWPWVIHAHIWAYQRPVFDIFLSFFCL